MSRSTDIYEHMVLTLRDSRTNALVMLRDISTVIDREDSGADVTLSNGGVLEVNETALEVSARLVELIEASNSRDK